MSQLGAWGPQVVSLMVHLEVTVLLPSGPLSFGTTCRRQHVTSFKSLLAFTFLFTVLICIYCFYAMLFFSYFYSSYLPASALHDIILSSYWFLNLPSYDFILIHVY